MNERLKQLAEQSGIGIAGDFLDGEVLYEGTASQINKLAELIMADMHRKVIASILITDVVMEEKGQKPASEDYIRAINLDFGVEE
jgi:hypothetical protein